MRNLLWIMLTLLLNTSCQQGKESRETDPPPTDDQRAERSSEDREEYTLEKWNFALTAPPGYQMYEGKLPGKSPVVNIYTEAENHRPPFAIHEAAELSYLAFLPRGFGVEAPSGDRKTLREWDGNLPVSFNVDMERSTVYLLDSGEAWAALIRFTSPPPGWDTHGLIFVHYSVGDFKGQCFSSGKEVPMENCDPMGGDRIKFSGKVSSQSKKDLHDILMETYFFSEDDEQRLLSDRITLDQPRPGSSIASPLTIRGQARGSWFFEAEAPVRLFTEEGRLLSEGSVKAQGEWMTEDFVPFETQLEFPVPGSAKGYLVLSRSNASGKPEHDRSFRIPVFFNKE